MTLQLDERARSILNDPELLAARDQHFTRMEALFSGEHPGEKGFELSGVVGLSETDIYS
jgi:hypothetical protein